MGCDDFRWPRWILAAQLLSPRPRDRPLGFRRSTQQTHSAYRRGSGTPMSSAWSRAEASSRSSRPRATARAISSISRRQSRSRPTDPTSMSVDCSAASCSGSVHRPCPRPLRGFDCCWSCWSYSPEHGPFAGGRPFGSDLELKTGLEVPSIGPEHKSHLPHRHGFFGPGVCSRSGARKRKKPRFGVSSQVAEGQGTRNHGQFGPIRARPGGAECGAVGFVLDHFEQRQAESFLPASRYRGS